MRPSRVSPPHQNEVMKTSYADRAVELLEKANADLDPELMSIPDIKNQLETYTRPPPDRLRHRRARRKLGDAERLASHRHIYRQGQRDRGDWKGPR